MQSECKVSIELVFKPLHSIYTNCTNPVKSRVPRISEIEVCKSNVRDSTFFLTDFMEVGGTNGLL